MRTLVLKRLYDLFNEQMHYQLLNRMPGKLIRTIVQARANFAIPMMAACYNLKRLVRFQASGIEAF